MEEKLEKANRDDKNLVGDNNSLHVQYTEAELALIKPNRTVDHLKKMYEDTIEHTDKQIKELIADRDDLRQRYDEQVSKLEKDIDEKQDTLGTMEKNLEMSNSEKKVLQEKYMDLQRQYQDSQFNLEKANNENKNLDNELKALQMQYRESEYALKKANRTADNLTEQYEDTIRHKDNQFKEVLTERDDLRNRFSKLADDKTDQIMDIADLSDPNRAMKLSEKFGELYDDQWTNAFEWLTGGKQKMPVKEAISLLLDVLLIR